LLPLELWPWFFAANLEAQRKSRFFLLNRADLYLCAMQEPISFLSKVQDSFSFFLPLIQDSLNLVRQNEISKYPIYVLSTFPFGIGTLLAESTVDSHGFSLYITTTEEFIRRGIIPIEKAKSFIATYKPIESYCCLFVTTEDIAQSRFIFYPIKT